MNIISRIKKSLLAKTLLIFVAIWIIIILIFSVVFNSTVSFFYNQVKDTYENQLDYIIADMENNLNRINSTFVSLSYDDSVMALALEYGNISIKDMREYADKIFLHINQLMTVNADIEDVQIYFPRWNRCISADGNLFYYNIDNLKTGFPHGSPNSMLVFSQNDIYLQPNYVYYGGKESDAIIIVKLNKSALDVLLNRMVSKTGGRFAVAIDTGKPIGDKAPVSLDDDDYFFFSSESDSIGIKIYEYAPKNLIRSKIINYRLYIVLVMVTLVISLIILLLYVYKTSYKPLKKLVKAFENVIDQNFDFSVSYEGDDEFSYIYDSFNYMVSKIKHLIDDVYTQNLLRAKAEYSQLQSKVAPHFLYNNFFVIKTLANLGDTGGIEKLADYLGKFYQYICANDYNDTTLYDEFCHAKNYTDIRKIINVKNLEVDFCDITDDYRYVYVPRLIIQPIIENCFKYAFDNVDKVNILRVSVLKAEKELRIFIEDNGQNISEKISVIESEVNSDKLTGLAGINRQLKINCKGQLKISVSELGGLCVELIIPEMEI